MQQNITNGLTEDCFPTGVIVENGHSRGSWVHAVGGDGDNTVETFDTVAGRWRPSGYTTAARGELAVVSDIQTGQIQC